MKQQRPAVYLQVAQSPVPQDLELPDMKVLVVEQWAAGRRETDRLPVSFDAPALVEFLMVISSALAVGFFL
jgi:hypothetical protein